MSFLPVFLIMVFIAVFLLGYLLIVPSFGSDRKIRKQINRRVREINSTYSNKAATSLLREKYLHGLSPIERTLESLPGMESLIRLIEQAGHGIRAYQVILISIAIALLTGLGSWIFTKRLDISLILGIVGIMIPYMKLSIDRNRRFDRFEAQLPDALDTVTRALKAGHPFSESLHMVGEEMDEPVSREFELTFAEMNYGFDSRVALLNLLDRMPSVSVMALVTSVLIQRETGGNLGSVVQQYGGKPALALICVC